MRVSAAALLLLGCLIAATVPLYAQMDAHLRLSGAWPSQYPGYAAGVAAGAYVGLGTAAEAALGDAEQVAEALLNAEAVDTAAAARKVGHDTQQQHTLCCSGGHMGCATPALWSLVVCVHACWLAVTKQ